MSGCGLWAKNPRSEGTSKNRAAELFPALPADFKGKPARGNSAAPPKSDPLWITHDFGLVTDLAVIIKKAARLSRLLIALIAGRVEGKHATGHGPSVGP